MLKYSAHKCKRSSKETFKVEDFKEIVDKSSCNDCMSSFIDWWPTGAVVDRTVWALSVIIWNLDASVSLSQTMACL